MDQTLAVDVGHRVADVDEPAKQEAEFEARVVGCGLAVEPSNGHLERFAPDETHSVEGTPVGERPHAVDGHDAGVLQPPRDLGLTQEPLPPDRVGGDLPADLLEGDLTLERAVFRDEDLTQATPGQGPDDRVRGSALYDGLVCPGW